ncbi:hypothetical protein [Streptomyces sp. NBC_00859]|uniref:hypothetical protein n=1 Tax=Streptomyces sp. NBC_00859 TaxID=2903682 RepID=UPI0038659574|nr:hypothetical protein OG584_27930 [Streptomyces sp. NBC_00859]
MPARTHPTRPQRRGPAQSGIDVRLPWWAVVLPALAFAVLLLLISAPGQAHADAGDAAVTHVLQRIQQSLPL